MCIRFSIEQDASRIKLEKIAIAILLGESMIVESNLVLSQVKMIHLCKATFVEVRITN